MSGTADGVVSLTEVSHCYGKIRAVDQISLGLPAGKMIGFIGPDGVGKSTLLGLISGSRRLQQGQVQVLGGAMGDARHRGAGLPAHRLHAPGAGQEPLSHPERV